MRHRSSRGKNALIFAATGWLFADLFIALAMGFLVANTVGQPLRLGTTTPTATATPLPLITATPKPALSLVPIPILVSGFDPQGVLSGNAAAITDAQNRVKAVINQTPSLKGKTAGIVLTFGGSPSNSYTDISLANKIAQAFNSAVLPPIGLQGLLFLNQPQSKTQYRYFFNVGQAQNTVELDIYIFSQ